MAISLNQIELSVGLEVVRTLADCLVSIGHSSRFRIAKYCVKPRRFTDIIFSLRLNPASFRFHAKVLMDCELLTKVERGIYKTTDLGKLLLELVDQASKLSD